MPGGDGGVEGGLPGSFVQAVLRCQVSVLQAPDFTGVVSAADHAVAAVADGDQGAVGDPPVDVGQLLGPLVGEPLVDVNGGG